MEFQNLRNHPQHLECSFRCPEEPRECLEFIDLVLGAQAFNVAFDMCILTLPINIVYKLHLSIRKRIGVVAIFAVGALVHKQVLMDSNRSCRRLLCGMYADLFTTCQASETCSGLRTTKIEDSNADNFYLANYKPAGTREVTVARKSSSINSRQELHPVPGTVTVKRDFTREDHREDSW
ncbi:hypothetical protein BGAL_0052g00070 [Botrytis galanthina]|uniref:Rhodopsin domain-containing protein n=1 Tax=Botrytis galanthina TaxID=278940 RepID=A0A4V4HVI3_9HELO|nr:hypothetical protein BGAL_0052g00070 [Botrytis galanthina]